MGSVADKIARKIAVLNRSGVVDLAGWRQGTEDAARIGFDDEHQDPCHTQYIGGQHLVSIMTEIIAEFREARKFVKIYKEAEDMYLPQGPPMSPLTLSFFSMWSMFDVRFGSSRETVGTCTLRIIPELDCPPWLMDVVARLQTREWDSTCTAEARTIRFSCARSVHERPFPARFRRGILAVRAKSGSRAFFHHQTACAVTTSCLPHPT